MVRPSKSSQSGQSLLEFAFLMPLLVGSLALLVEVQTVINGAIVNQRFSRQHLHHLLFNHRHYPEHQFLGLKDQSYMERWWIGISEEINDRPSATLQPSAPKFKVGRKKVPPGEDDSPNPTRRQNLRLKISTFICLPPVGPKVGQFYSEDNIEEETFAGGSFRGFCRK